MHIVNAVPEIGIATAIAASGFVQPVSPQLEHDVADHLAGGDLVYTLMDGGQVVGFAILNVWGDILYLSGIILEAAHQRRENLNQVIARARLDVPLVTYFALRTQSLRMWKAALALCDTWFPQAHDCLEVPPPFRAIGDQVAGRIGSVFPVTKGYYGAPLYGEEPVHHNESLQRWWRGICSFQDGDAVVCVGQLLG